VRQLDNGACRHFGKTLPEKPMKKDLIIYLTLKRVAFDLVIYFKTSKKQANKKWALRLNCMWFIIEQDSSLCVFTHR